MGPLEFLGTISGYLVVSHTGGIVGTLVGICLAHDCGCDRHGQHQAQKSFLPSLQNEKHIWRTWLLKDFQLFFGSGGVIISSVGVW